MSLTHKEWIDREKAALDKFQQFWENGMKNYPKVFFTKMGDGDWQEQYDVWHCHDQPVGYDPDALNSEALVLQGGEDE